MDRPIIGVVGPIGSGKGTTVKMLEGRGFTSFSLSDRIREQAKAYGYSQTREVLQNLGDELRFKFGRDVLARRTAAMDEFKDADKIVVDSIRHPSEIEYFRDAFDAKIVGITASAVTRFNFLLIRHREGDPKTFAEFLKADRRELETPSGEHVIQVQRCLDMADLVIVNDGSLTDLKREIERALVSMGIEGNNNGKERK